MVSSRRAPAGSEARRARAERILDATAELLEAHGYRRVSIDDVATRTRIGKGTIYLHWKTREALFWAVLQRETTALLEGLVRQLADEAGLVLPHRLMPAIFVEVVRRPLVKAVLLSDEEVLGALTADESVAVAQRELAGQPYYFELLAAQDLLADELTAETAGYILGSVMRGFFADADPRAAGRHDGAPALPLDRRAELLGLVLFRTLQKTGPVATDAIEALRDNVVAMFEGIIAAHRGQLERAY
jgi:AcrR family transcriptional regulator